MAYRYWKPPIHNNGGISLSQRKSGNKLKQLLEELHREEKIEVDPQRFAKDKYYRFDIWCSSIWNSRPKSRRSQRSK